MLSKKSKLTSKDKKQTRMLLIDNMIATSTSVIAKTYTRIHLGVIIANSWK